MCYLNKAKRQLCFRSKITPLRAPLPAKKQHGFIEYFRSSSKRHPGLTSTHCPSAHGPVIFRRPRVLGRLKIGTEAGTEAEVPGIVDGFLEPRSGCRRALGARRQPEPTPPSSASLPTGWLSGPADWWWRRLTAGAVGRCGPGSGLVHFHSLPGL